MVFQRTQVHFSALTLANSRLLQMQGIQYPLLAFLGTRIHVAHNQTYINNLNLGCRVRGGSSVKSTSALPENRDSIPSTHMETHNHSEDPMPPSDLKINILKSKLCNSVSRHRKSIIPEAMRSPSYFQRKKGIQEATVQIQLVLQLRRENGQTAHVCRTDRGELARGLGRKQRSMQTSSSTSLKKKDPISLLSLQVFFCVPPEANLKDCTLLLQNKLFS